MGHKLLSHKCQTPALITFLVCFVLITGSAFAHSDLLSAFMGRTVPQVILIVILYASLLITIFSAEKIEDEMITAMRLHSATFAFLVGFGIIAVLNIIQAILPDAAYNALKEWRADCSWNGNAVMYLIILYFIVFKIKVWKLVKRMKDEE